MVSLCSIYAKNNILYLAERHQCHLDDTDSHQDSNQSELKIIARPYDSVFGIPTSLDDNLPVDQVVLNQYTIENVNSTYIFEYRKGEPNGYLTYTRNYELKKDIFFVRDIIVHVQDYEVTDEKVEKVIEGLLTNIKFSDHDPVSFMKLADEEFGKQGIDLVKEFERMEFVKQNITEEEIIASEEY